MKITVFTGNQPRHVALIYALAGVAEEVFAIQECSTLFPGQVADFYAKSAVMQAYFQRVIAAERAVFGSLRFLPPNARSICMKDGDINSVPFEVLDPALHSDAYIVFGASYIKGRLCNELAARRAFNIHMGISPYYRGSSCNFWALYDRRSDLVGATIHLLSSGLDSGAMLFHALPPADTDDGFLLGMRAVKAAHDSVVQALQDGRLQSLEPVKQDKSHELRYTRNADFTDAVAEEYLQRPHLSDDLRSALQERDISRFLRPFVESASARRGSGDRGSEVLQFDEIS
jgi:hypothetical protein